MSEEKVKTKFKDVAIGRGGNQIVLPEGMSYAEGREWLTRQEQAEEKPVNVYHEIEGFPLDAAISVLKSMNEIYGFASLESTSGFFGPTPPMLVQVPIAGGKFETAVLGKIAPPTWEGGSISLKAQGESLIVTGAIKRKHEDKVKKLLQHAQKRLLKHSIYKGQAVILDLSWVENEEDFHPINHAPKFMDLDNIKVDLILNRNVYKELDSSVFMLIDDTETCRFNRVPLKAGFVFAGPYGTGKTLTARKIAEKCVSNGWSFFYLKTPGQMANTLKMAERYSPAAVFLEDCDDILSGDRCEALNKILNTMDGIDTKDKPVITIFTTNHPEKINPAAQRPGRIDKIITYQPPDAETALKFVKAVAVDSNGRSMLSDKIDDKAVGEKFNGLIPASITEAINQAKRYAIRRCGKNPAVIETEDLVDAAESLLERNSMLLCNVKKTNAEQALEVIRGFGDYLNRRDEQVL